MPSIASMAANEEDISDMPPIEEASTDSPTGKPAPRGGRAAHGGAPRGGRTGEGGPPRGGRVGEGFVQRGPRNPSGGDGPRPQYQSPRPLVIPGKIEEPTRTNVFVPPSCIFFTQRRQCLLAYLKQGFVEWLRLCSGCTTSVFRLALLSEVCFRWSKLK